MKRYRPTVSTDGYHGDPTAEMTESSDGEYYSRADLIAAGCLVPVPDGEAVRADNLFPDTVFSAHSGMHIIIQPYDGSDYVWPMALDGSGIQQFLCQSPVQPVRLVRLEDVG